MELEPSYHLSLLLDHLQSNGNQGRCQVMPGSCGEETLLQPTASVLALLAARHAAGGCLDSNHATLDPHLPLG